jgi:AraC-like DNA-binding protein/tetratricopeptide (TPR) repeat protein
MDGIERAERIAPDNRRLLPQHVKRALAYMRANMAERITLAGLASACGAPERSLLRQFQQFVGLPPLTYLRRLRLNTAKGALARPGGNEAISDIALRCGFVHLGRFATEYRRLFGETPSETRRRVRARAADERLAQDRALPSVGREKPSLLILPLRTETLQESLEARELTERLAATLSRIHIASVTLAHPSHPVSMRLPQPRNAGAEYCLLGRLIRRDGRTRVIARLVDIAADRHIWGDSFDGCANDPFELQDRVVDGVTCGVVSHITDSEIARSYNKDPKDLSARDLAMRALPLILAANAASARKAVEILDRAVALDPSDAAAVALLSFAQIELIGRYATASPATALDAAVGLSQRAALLDDNDPLVLVARGGVAGWVKQFDEADALLTRAVAIDPTCAWARERYAYSRFVNLPIGRQNEGESLFWSRTTQQHRADVQGNRPEDLAIADFHRALQLRGPGISRSNCLHGIGTAYCKAGRWNDARLWLHKALGENPDGAWIHRSLSCIAFMMGDRDGVAQSVERMRRAHPYLTVSYHASNFPVEPPWLDALAKAGMPLS